MILEQQFRSRLEGSLAAIASLRDEIGQIAAIANTIIQRLQQGGCVYTAGNGGSAAHAMHLAEELIGRYRTNRQPHAAMCLNADATAMTCIGNDYGFDQIFARQCQALVKPQDVLVAFSTSGNSANLVNALEVTRRRGGATVGVLGKDGGRCLHQCDLAIVVRAGDDTAHIQEAHQVILHLLCEAVEACSSR